MNIILSIFYIVFILITLLFTNTNKNDKSTYNLTSIKTKANSQPLIKYVIIFFNNTDLIVASNVFVCTLMTTSEDELKHKTPFLIPWILIAVD